MRKLFRILVIKGINWCVFICCINFVYLNCQPYYLFIVTLDTSTLCLYKVYRNVVSTSRLVGVYHHVIVLAIKGKLRDFFTC